jgi:hypothetical protein
MEKLGDDATPLIVSMIALTKDNIFVYGSKRLLEEKHMKIYGPETSEMIKKKIRKRHRPTISYEKLISNSKQAVLAEQEKKT